jgi:polysaccharide biosynthesis transport protein
MEQQKSSSVDYLRLLRRVVAHRWRLVIAGFLVIALPTLAWTVLATEDTYEAHATLFLLPERSDPAFMREFSSPEVNALYHVLLRSRSLAQGVTEALPKESRDELTRRLGVRDYVLAAMNHIRRLRGMEVVVYSPSELAIRELQEARMNFNIGKDGTVIVSATAFSPRVAVDLANTYVEVLLARSSSFARQQARGTRELLESLLLQGKTSQNDAEEALRKFQARTGGAVKLPEESRADLAQLAQLEGTLSDLQVSREIAQSRLAYLKGDYSKGTPQPVIDPSTQALRERLTQLETKLTAFNEKYTEQHPLVLSVRSEIDQAQERLKTALKTQQTPKPGGVSTLKPLENAQLSKQMADLEVEIVSLQAREAGLKQRVTRLKQGLTVMSSREQEYAGLARAVETQAKLTAMLSEKLTGARISEQSQIRGIQVIDLAALPRQPSPKQPLKLLVLGLLGGLALGMGAAVLAEYSTQVIETEQEAFGATSLPVLGSIPSATGQRLSTSEESTPVIFAANAEPHSLPADACRAIRTAIDCQALDRPMKTLLVTSPGAHEGKSTVLVNLAMAFVETGRRVLLVDADLRRASLHRALKVPNERGLVDMLKGSEWPEGFRWVAPGLDFIPSGIKTETPGSLLSSRRMTELIAMAAQRADIVLIDSPPILAVADTLPLMAQVDGVLLVVRHGFTRRRSLMRAKAQLDRVHARLVGIVVNGLSARETRRHYAEYTHYVGAAKAGKRKKQKA